MAIVYIVFNDSLLFLETKRTPLPFPPLPSPRLILGRLIFSVFSLISSVNCLNTIDKIFAPMDDDRPCLYQNLEEEQMCFLLLQPVS